MSFGHHRRDPDLQGANLAELSDAQCFVAIVLLVCVRCHVTCICILLGMIGCLIMRCCAFYLSESFCQGSGVGDVQVPPGVQNHKSAIYSDAM